ncbi:MAG: Wzz/FepE/Etk N-terminal domain-containing protein [Candidatus Zixiibacteriota bacterium]
MRILTNHRKTIIVNSIVVAILAAGISFLLPKTYQAKTTVLPPETESGLSGLMGLSSGLLAQAASNFALPIMATPSDIYASMLESETILGRVVDSLGLVKFYGVQSKWEAIGALKSDVKIRVEMDGIVSVTVDAKNAELAANAANLMVSSLDDFKKEMRSRKGRDFSTFLSNRLVETDSSLRLAANLLRDFQETHGAIALDIQSEALIKNLAEEKSKLTASEVELEVMRKLLYPDNPEVIRKELEVREIRSGLRRIESGAITSHDSIISALDIPLSRVPDLSLQLAVLTRNVKIFEMTYELLSQQYEMAQLQERRDTPTITVLDAARTPEMPIWPRKKWIVITAFALAFIFTSTVVVIKDAVSKEDSALARFWRPLREILLQIGRRPLG